ncbi:MAG: helix-turn-helix domain-containing protein [Phycisphaerales bacterium]
MLEPTPTATETGELLTGRQLADRLRLHEKTVQLWGRTGRIPRQRLGARVIRYNLADVLEALADEHTAERGPAR